MVVGIYTRIRMCFMSGLHEVYSCTVHISSPKVPKILIVSATEICTPNLILVHVGNKSSITLIKRHSVQGAFCKKAKIIFLNK